jgi:hypothetical protein
MPQLACNLRKKEKPCFALPASPPQSSVGQWCTQQASKQAPLIQAQPASASSASVTRCGIGIVRGGGHILAPHPATLQIDLVDRHGSGGQSHPRRRRGHHGRRSGGGAARRGGGTTTSYDAWSAKQKFVQGNTISLFGWLVADGWYWFVLREEYCWLVAGGWFVLREKYC